MRTILIGDVHGCLDGFECVGIDTGCCFGGRLTAMLLEERAFVQVQARRAYAKMPSSK